MSDPEPVRPFPGLKRLLHPRWREDVYDDLHQEFEERKAAGTNARVASLLFCLALVRAAAVRREHDWEVRDTTPSIRRAGDTMEDFWQDVRYALRGLARAPLFAAVALMTLAAGIGLTVAMFAVVHGVVLRPLDYPEADRLVLLQGEPGALRGVSMPQHLDFREGATTLQESSAWQGWAPVLRSEDGGLRRTAGASVSETFFRVAGVTPAAGRLFDDRDGAPGHEPVVVVSHRLWTSRFAADPGFVDSSLELDQVRYRVVGVAPEGFEDPVARGLGWQTPDVWRAAPPSFREAEADRGWVGFWSVGRLRPGASAEALTQELRRAVLERSQSADDPARYADQFRAITVRDAVVEEIRPTLRILFLATALVLIIACVNVANLLLSRASTRRSELAVRSSLGAHRARLVRQLFTESMVLGLGGALAGALLAVGLTRLVVQLSGALLPRSADVSVDLVVLAFALLAGLGTTVLFGVVPALRATDHLSENRARGGSATRSTGRLRRSLVVLETALAMVLLTGAGLLAGAALRLEAVDPGFETRSVAAINLDLGDDRFPTAELQADALRRVEEALLAHPGVTGVGAITDRPLGGAVNSTRIRKLEDTEQDAAARRNVLVRAITPGLFQALEIPVLEGRVPDRGARPGAEEVAVVNEEFARTFFPDGNVVGQVVSVRGVERRITGVVRAVREFDLTSSTYDPVLYTPYPQEREGWMRGSVTLMMSLTGLDRRALDDLRAAITNAEPRILVGEPAPMEATLDALKQGPRLRAGLVLGFAALALLLAAVGMGGVVAYNVSQRVREIGIRLALGARSGQVQALVLRDTAQMTLLGIGLGLVAALFTSRLLAEFLFQIDPGDPKTIAGSAAVLMAVGLLAAWMPARRAARVDPAHVLRSD